MGALQGIRVVEMGGVGPAPHCGMLLADMGADVVRVDRPAAAAPGAEYDLPNRNKRSVAINLKSAEGVGAVRRLIDQADVVIEGFRPGVMERLGLGPEKFESTNRRLVYGRMTGWGQTGPLARSAGHDINYIAVTGALHAIGRSGEPPAIPLNLVGDYGGGSLYMAFGILAAVIEARGSGRGQVVDCAIVDGVANLLAMHHGLRQQGAWTNDRGANLSDGGAPFYDIYGTLDGRHITIGAVEPKFYRDLIARLGLEGEDLPEQYDRAGWDRLKNRFTEIFASKTRADWCELLEGTDACFAPVLSLDEAASHAQNRARQNLVEADGIRNPAPAPRLSRTPGALRRPPAAPGADAHAALADWGFSPADIARLDAATVDQAAEELAV